MLQKIAMKAVVIVSFAALLAITLPAQDAGVVNPPSTRGLNPVITGVFVAPIPNTPFTAVALSESKRPLQDGTTESFKTLSQIARDSEGRIRNERRQLVPDTFTGTPPLLSSHIYDPATRLNTFLNEAQHIARQSKLKGPAPDYEHAAGSPNPTARVKNGEPRLRVEDLGTQVMEDVTVQGRRITRTIPASASGTGQPVTVVDEFWYSDELHLNMLVKHSDPRTGEQTLTVTQVKRGDPDAQLFQIPSDFKVVDETPGNAEN